MPLRELERSEWSRYFANLAREFGAARDAVLEKLGISDSTAADMVPLDVVAYDPQDDLFEVVTAAYGHAIHHPRQIFVDETPSGPRHIEVLDAEGGTHAIALSMQPSHVAR